MRKAFNHYENLWEIKKQLTDEQYVAFDRAVCEVQFLEKHIDDITFDDKVLTLLWTSIKHTLRTSIEGYCNKSGIDYDSLFQATCQQDEKPLDKVVEDEFETPCEVEYDTPREAEFDTPCQGATQGAMQAPTQQEEEKEKEEEKEEEKEKGEGEESEERKGRNKLVQAWNDVALQLGLPKVQRLTPKRLRKIKTRERENPNFTGDFLKALEQIYHSSFLRGNNDRGWKVDFDWLIENDTNLVKVLEGKYGDKVKKRSDLSKFGTVGGFSSVFNDGIGRIEYDPDIVDVVVLGAGHGQS